MVPFINLQPYVDKVRLCAEHGTLCPDFGVGVDAILDRHEFIGKETVARLEGLLRTRFGAAHAIACGSGSSALTLALAAYGIDNGLVAMPNVTFWATYEAIVHANCTPLLIDIDKGDLQMSFEEFERAHERHRFHAAILPHLFGWCSGRLADFRAFCRDKNIVLIEDGAQAFGVEYEGRSVFADARTITLSFFPAKVIGGITDGGAVLTRQERIATAVRALANHGRTPGQHYEHELVGWNSRMSGIDAEWLCQAVAHADTVIDARRALRSSYRQKLFDLARRVNMRAYFEDGNVRGNGYLEVWTLPKPSAPVVDALFKLGVGAARVYPRPISDQPDAQRRAVRHGDLFNSYDFCNRVLNLPLWYGMPEENVTAVVDALTKVLL